MPTQCRRLVTPWSEIQLSIPGEVLECEFDSETRGLSQLARSGRVRDISVNHASFAAEAFLVCVYILPSVKEAPCPTPCLTSKLDAHKSCSKSPSSATSDAALSMRPSAAAASPTAPAPATTIPATAPKCACPTSATARPSSKPSPRPPRFTRPNARWPPFATSRGSAPNSSRSTSKSASCVRQGPKIWMRRPTCQKKTLRAIQDAVQAEVGSLLQVIVEARRRLGAFDLQDLEEATRAALQRAGARLLKELLEETEDASQAPLFSCGPAMRCEGPRPKRLVSLLGKCQPAPAVLSLSALLARHGAVRQRPGHRGHAVLAGRAPPAGRGRRRNAVRARA